MAAQYRSPKSKTGKNGLEPEDEQSGEPPIYTAERLKTLKTDLTGLAADLDAAIVLLKGEKQIVVADKMLKRSLKHIGRFVDNATLAARQLNRSR